MNTSIARLIYVVLLATLTSACTHLISINPETQSFSTEVKNLKKVGLYISDQNLALKVTTPAREGDSVVYLPYRDLETPIYAMLQRSFSDVARLNSPSDPIISKESIHLIVQPTITTMSSSGIFGMWTPNAFEVNLKLQFTETSTGKEFLAISATGQGKATAGELLKDVALAAKRASADAIQKIAEKIDRALAAKK